MHPSQLCGENYHQSQRAMQLSLVWFIETDAGDPEVRLCVALCLQFILNLNGCLHSLGTGCLKLFRQVTQINETFHENLHFFKLLIRCNFWKETCGERKAWQYTFQQSFQWHVMGNMGDVNKAKSVPHDGVALPLRFRDHFTFKVPILGPRVLGYPCVVWCILCTVPKWSLQEPLSVIA